jgi:hypothetical protein
MTEQLHNARRAADTRSMVLRAVLAVALLIPVGILFVGAWRADTNQITSTRSEQDGARYIRALQPLTSAITQAESLGVASDALTFDAIDRATLDIGRVDDSVGGALRTHAFFDNLRTKIQQLHARALGDPQTAFAAFSEVSALIQQLYDKVRMASGLIRDPEAATYYLEDAAARQLPASVIAAGQYGDLITAGSQQPNSVTAALTPQILAVRASLFGAADILSNDINEAVNESGSGTITGDLLAKLDLYRRSIDSLAPASVMTIDFNNTNFLAHAMSDKVRTEDAATVLNGELLDTIDVLLANRLTTTLNHRWATLGTGVLGLLLALSPLVVGFWSRRRAARLAAAGGADTVPIRDAAAIRATAMPGGGRRPGDLPSRPGEPVSRTLTVPTGVRRSPPAPLGGETTGELVPIRYAGAQHRALPEPPAGFDYWERSGAPQ